MEKNYYTLEEGAMTKTFRNWEEAMASKKETVDWIKYLLGGNIEIIEDNENSFCYAINLNGKTKIHTIYFRSSPR